MIVVLQGYKFKTCYDMFEPIHTVLRALNFFLKMGMLETNWG